MRLNASDKLTLNDPQSILTSVLQIQNNKQSKSTQHQTNHRRPNSNLNRSHSQSGEASSKESKAHPLPHQALLQQKKPKKNTTHTRIMRVCCVLFGFLSFVALVYTKCNLKPTKILCPATFLEHSKRCFNTFLDLGSKF